jgi:hypothetical protein
VKLAPASDSKPKPNAKAKEKVVVDETSDSRKGVPWLVKSVPVKATRTWTVCMPQRFRKTA